MSDRIRLIEHGGKQVAFIDYAGLHGDELIRYVKQVEASTKNIDRDNLLTLVDVEGISVDREALQNLKQQTAQSTAKVAKCAVINAVGVHEFFLQIITRHSGINAQQFATRDEALNWLVAD